MVGSAEKERESMADVVEEEYIEYMGLKLRLKRIDEEEEVISSTTVQFEEEEEEDDDYDEEEEEEEDDDDDDDDDQRNSKKEKDMAEFMEFIEIWYLKFEIMKEYMVCMRPYNGYHNLHKIGVIRAHIPFDASLGLGLSHSFKTFKNSKEARHSQHSNIDGTPVFAGYVFGDMDKYTKIICDGGTQEELGRLLEAEVARNHLNPAFKV